MRYGVRFQSPHQDMGATDELILFESEAAARGFVAEVQPLVGVALVPVRVEFSVYEPLEDE